MLELYYFPTSYWSRVAALALAEKELEHQRHVVAISRNENFAPDYMRINPKGVVPTLVHDGTPVCEAPNIVAYLDGLAAPKLRADDDDGRVWEDAIASVPIELLSYATWVLGKRGEKSADILADKIVRAERLAAEHPDLASQYLAKKAHFEAFSRSVYDKAVVAKARSDTESTIERLATRVTASPFLAGDAFGYADAVAASVLFRLADLGEGAWHQDDGHPVTQYFDRLWSRPSYQQVFVQDPNIIERYRTDGRLRRAT